MARSWKVPKIWPDSLVFILGGGPTLIETLKGRQITSHRVIGVNNCFRLGAWIDISWFGDSKWYRWNHEEYASFPGLKVTCCHKFVTAPRRGIKALLRGKPKGLETNPKKISWNRSSGASAINLAVHLGAKRIVLVGFDMRLVNGVKNWSPHPQERTKPNPYERFREPFKNIMQDAKKLGIEIVNATPKSTLREWVPEVKLADELK